MRLGDWMQTATGRQFWPLDPRVEEVCIEDIAHALSNQCRFAGHCREFYSVAEHSVRVSSILPGNLCLAGLLHDAAEAYLVDLPRPVKRSPGIGPEYMKVETQNAAVIEAHFGLPAGIFEWPEIKAADNILLMTEARDIMMKPPVSWKESNILPLPERIRPWSPRKAHGEFLETFFLLSGEKDVTVMTAEAFRATRTLD